MTLEFAGMIVDAVTSIVEQPVKVMPGLDEKTVPPAPPSINKVAEPENGGGFDEPYENWKSVAFIDAPPVLKVINSFVPSCEPQALIIAPVIYGHWEYVVTMDEIKNKNNVKMFFMIIFILKIIKNINLSLMTILFILLTFSKMNLMLTFLNLNKV